MRLVIDANDDATDSRTAPIDFDRQPSKLEMYGKNRKVFHLHVERTDCNCVAGADSGRLLLHTWSSLWEKNRDTNASFSSE